MKRPCSNYTVDSFGFIHNDDGSFYVGDSSNGSNGSGSNTGSSWTPKDTTGLVSGLADTAASVLNSIFGKNNQYLANSYNTLYQQEKRTNTILWVVIGLVVALGVFLVIRKTK